MKITITRGNAHAWGWCGLCGQPGFLTDNICTTCKLELSQSLFHALSPFVCPFCGSPMLHADAICPCNGNQPNVQVLGPYRGLLLEMIQRYKFYKSRELSVSLASLILEESDSLETGTLVVPVPCSLKGMRDRGWDQMELVARKVSEMSGHPWMSLVYRAGRGQQKKLNRIARTTNESRFFPHQSLVNGTMDFSGTRRLLLIDDVYTTGTTMRQCMSLIGKYVDIPVFGLCLAKD